VYSNSYTQVIAIFLIQCRNNNRHERSNALCIYEIKEFQTKKLTEIFLVTSLDFMLKFSGDFLNSRFWSVTIGEYSNCIQYNNTRKRNEILDGLQSTKIIRNKSYS